MKMRLSGDSTIETTRSFPRISSMNSINNCEIRLVRSVSSGCSGLEIRGWVGNKIQITYLENYRIGKRP